MVACLAFVHVLIHIIIILDTTIDWHVWQPPMLSKVKLKQLSLSKKYYLKHWSGAKKFFAFKSERSVCVIIWKVRKCVCTDAVSVAVHCSNQRVCIMWYKLTWQHWYESCQGNNNPEVKPFETKWSQVQSDANKCRRIKMKVEETKKKIN